MSLFKVIVHRLSLMLLALLAGSWTAYAAFEDTGAGARPAGLGNAYTTLGNDSLSIYYNPAGLSRMQQAEIAAEYSRLDAGLTDGSNLGQYTLSGGIPLAGGALSAGWKQLTVTGLYHERTLSLGYGRWVSNSLAVGVTVKQLYRSYNAPTMIVDDNGNILPGTPSLFLQNGMTKSAYSGDLGLLYRLGRLQWLGLTAQNLNAPNVSLDSSDSDQVARTYHASWAYQDYRKFSATIDGELERKPGGPNDDSATAAVEKGWLTAGESTVFVRGAYTTGTRELRQVSTGAGLVLGSFQIDYAFVFDLSGLELGNDAGTHRFSLTYRFETQRHQNQIAQPAAPASLAPAPKSTAPPEGSIMNVPDNSFEEEELKP